MEDKVEVNIIELEDNEEYIIFEALENQFGKYLFLAKEKDENSITIRKIIKKDGKDYLTKLDSDEEFDEVIKTFYEKHGKKERI